MKKDNLFEEMYKEYYNSIYFYVYKHIMNKEEAEDLVQDIFFSCYKSISRYDKEKGAFSTWLYVIANNKLKNYYRDKKIYVDIDEFSEILGSEENLEERVICLQHLRDVVAKAIKNLPEKSQKIVIMAYFEGMKTEQIGKIMGMSCGNVRITMMRALRKMQSVFEAEELLK